MTNTDLLDSIAMEKFVNHNVLTAARLINFDRARLWNGSFGYINSSNLVVNGMAEDAVSV